MKKLLFILSIILLASCSKVDYETLQKVTYRINVTETGYKMWYVIDSTGSDITEKGIYDTTFFASIGDKVGYQVFAKCSEDQRLSFNMQILVNDMEMKSKSITVKNICQSVNYEMTYILK